MKIGVYSPNWIGDAVLALPFIEYLKSQNPNAKICILCKEWVTDVYQNHPAIDELISIEKKYMESFLGSIKTGYLLRSKKFDLFYTLTDSFRSALILRISGSPKRIGYKSQMRSILLTNSIKLPKKMIHRSEKYIKMINENIFFSQNPKLYVSDDEKEWGLKEIKKMQLKQPVALFPFSVANARTIPNIVLKKWIQNSNKNYIVFGSKDDNLKGEELVSLFNNLSIKSICGKYSLRQSIILISLCNYAIAADSGLGHIAVALGVPTISFFGIGIPEITSPIGTKSIIIKHCNPCLNELCEDVNDKLCLKKITKKDIEVALNRVVNM